MGKTKSNYSASRILKVMSNQAKSSYTSDVHLAYAIVTSINPLKIKIDNRLEIGEEFIQLGVLCQETIIKVPTEAITKHIHLIPQHTTETGGSQDPHTHVIKQFYTIDAMPQIRLWRGLQIGDNVLVEVWNDGQLYFIRERVEGVPWYDTSAIGDNK